MERGHTQRQACELIELPRSILKYRSVRAERDAPALDAMRRIAATYPRYGYRRVRIFLRREGHAMGPQRTYRLWCVAGLQLPRRRPRRRVATSRPRPLPATGPNQVWAYDFVHDACANGQKLKCLTVIDEFTRESLAIDVAGSIRSARVIDVLTRLISVHGAPMFLRSDNGPEFISNRILVWLTEVKIDTRPDRSRQALAERRRRELQRQVPRRVPEHGVVSQPRRGPGPDRNLAPPLQCRSGRIRALSTAPPPSSASITSPPTREPSSSSQWSEFPGAGQARGGRQRKAGARQWRSRCAPALRCLP